MKIATITGHFLGAAFLLSASSVAAQDRITEAEINTARENLCRQTLGYAECDPTSSFDVITRLTLCSDITTTALNIIGNSAYSEKDKELHVRALWAHKLALRCSDFTRDLSV
jgi:hypothetical protein